MRKETVGKANFVIRILLLIPVFLPPSRAQAEHQLNSLELVEPIGQGLSDLFLSGRDDGDFAGGSELAGGDGAISV